MLRIPRSLAIFLIAGAIFPIAGNAAPFGALPSVQSSVKNAKSEKVTFTLVNKSDVTRAVAVDGHTYTLNPHQQLSISAPAGSQLTEVTSDSSTPKVLLTVDRTQKGATISLN